MTEIRVTYPAKRVDEMQIGIRLYANFLGLKGRVAVIFSFVLPMVGVPTLLHVFTDLDMLRTEVMVLGWVFYGSLACWMLTSVAFVRKARRINDQTTYRNRDVTWVLTANGCQQVDGIFLPWADASDVFRIKNMTVIDFTIRRAAVLPDDALPEGLFPDAILTQIQRWRQT